MRLRACGIAFIPLISAGCTGGGFATSNYSVVDLPYPLALETAVPDGVLPQDVLERDGCFYFRREGAIYPIPSGHDSPDDASPQPYCVVDG